MSKTILIVGGAGYVGSHVNKLLCEKGYQTVVFDNLSRGSRKNVTNGEFFLGDIGNRHDLATVFEKTHFDAVMHFAALTDVGDSFKNPAQYYHNNVANTLNLLEYVVAHHIKTFVFSSSAAIFGLPLTETIGEDHPCNPINPYGRTKLIVEMVLEDFDKAYGLKSCCLRYFNACGNDPEGKIHSLFSIQKNLIPLIFQSLHKETALTLFGTDYPTPDGTCIRDYIHVSDLAEAHLLGLEKLLQDNKSSSYNLGNGHGYSVKEVLAATEKISGKRVKTINGVRRPGDPPILLANAQKAKLELGWTPNYADLENMISSAWKSFTQNNERIRV